MLVSNPNRWPMWLGTGAAVLISGLGLSCATGGGRTNSSTSSNALVVMTYNIRSASKGSPFAWELRRPLMKECLQKFVPDILGTQEAHYQQLKDLVADFPEYDWIGQCRNGGSQGEFMAVFYRKARFEPVAFDHFWLSDTPETIGSKTWGDKLPPRLATWVRFRDRKTQQEFYFLTTHVDGNKAAQEKSVQLIRKRVAEFEAGVPVLVTGDFNAVPGRDPAYDILTGDGFFSDTWTEAKTRRGEGYSTFNGFKTLVKNERRIDWVLARGNVTVDAAEIVTFSRDGKFPSDHLPVVAWLRWR